MRKNVVLFFILALFPAVSAQQASDAGTITTIRALERAWADAQAHNNNRSLALIFDNGLIYVEYGKLVTKGDYLSRVRQASAGNDQIEMEPITVRVYPKAAIVLGSYREKRRERGQVTLQRWRFIDTWVYKKEGWVLVAAAAAPIAE